MNSKLVVAKPAAMRLDRLLANMGYGSRREIADLARLGHIMLDGEVLREGDQQVYVTANLKQRMSVMGQMLDPPPGFCLMLHKPAGVTCSHKEVGALVYSLLPERWRRREPAISTVGRLDKETSGLLLMTDDGALLHKIISPRAKIAKRYVARLAQPLRGDAAALFAAGTMVLEGEQKPLLPAKVEIFGEALVALTINEGRYHQVRRMFAALGNHVDALHRDQIGGLHLPGDLMPGQWRVLEAEEVARIF